MKRTEWYPASVTPARNGTYEWRCYNATYMRIRRAKWDGAWEYAGDVRPERTCCSCQWRGLTKPAERAA